MADLHSPAGAAMRMAHGLHRTSWQATSQKGPLVTVVNVASDVLRLHPFRPANAALKCHCSSTYSSTAALVRTGARLKQQQLCSSFTRLTSSERAALIARPPQALPKKKAPIVSRLMQQADITIQYINATGQEDPEFEVVVFQRDQNTANARYKDVAWKVIKAQSGAEFVYTIGVQVAATYKSGGATVWQGPFDCELGETWAISHHVKDGTPLLKLKAKGNALDTLVVQNIKPATFTGRMYKVLLLKDDSPLVSAERVGVNSQVLFQLKPTVYFGVVYGIQHGQTFDSFVDSSYNTPFNLMEYAGTGLRVTLTYDNESGEYTFTGSPAL